MAIKMVSKFPDFNKYSVQDILVFTDKVREFEPRSDLSAAYIPSYYSTDGKLKFSSLNGNLVTQYTDPETKQLNMVVFGSNKIESTLRDIFSYQKENGLEQLVTGLETAQVKGIEDQTINIFSTPEIDEYVISTKDHRDLKVKQLSAEARAVRNFIKNYSDDIKIFELDLSKHNSVALIINAGHVWTTRPNSNNDPEAIERQYTSLYLLHADELPTRNVVISHAGQIIGYAIYDVLEDYSCAIFHSLKVDHAYNHAFDFGLHVLASRLYTEGIEYINIEEDMGIPGLRVKKNHLMPVKKLLRYSARPTS